MAYLGEVHTALDDNKKAMDLLEKSRVLRLIAHAYFTRKDLESTEAYLDKALKIFQKSNHPSICLLYQDLAGFAVEKANNKEKVQQSNELKKQTIRYLTQAQEIVMKNDFPPEFHIVQRI